MRLTKILTVIALISLSFGCGNRDNLSPFSPRAKLKHEVQNQGGKIGELETLNNAIKTDVGQLKSQAEVHARDIQAMQQGTGNKTNSGVQILQGDGAMIVLMVLAALGMFLVFFYRTKALKNQKTAEILAQQIGYYNNSDLDNRVCMAALNSEVESDVYHLLMKHKAKTLPE